MLISKLGVYAYVKYWGSNIDTCKIKKKYVKHTKSNVCDIVNINPEADMNIIIVIKPKNRRVVYLF